MESLFFRYKNALVLMLVLLAQVVLLAMQVRRPAPDLPDGHNVRLWRYWVASVVTPPERAAHGIGRSTRGVWDSYVNLRHLQEQNQLLEQENDRLRLEQASLAEDARDGQRLREMLDFRGQYIDKTVPAQVIGTSGTDTAHVIYIDKGSKDGLRAQMPVITPDGIVGKVKNVFPGTAQVLLISDQTSGAGVMLQTTRIRGVMKGDASGQPQMINISPDDRIQAGEAVLTSGGDQVYPRGLPVGVVEQVVSDPDTSYVNVLIKPNANLAKLEEVLVITEIAGKMPFTQEKDVMQSEVDALAEKQRAADILSEKLPSLRPEDFKKTDAETDGDETATAGGGDPARPMRPPSALHADRYTPGAAPAADTLTPGEAPPLTYRAAPSKENPGATSRPLTRLPANSTTALTEGAAPVSRFPPKKEVTGTSVSPSRDISAELAAGSKPALIQGTAKTASGAVAGGASSAAAPFAAGTRRITSSLLAVQPADAGGARRLVPVGDGMIGRAVGRTPRPTVTGAGTIAANGNPTSPSSGASLAPRTPRPATAATGGPSTPNASLAVPPRVAAPVSSGVSNAARTAGAIANQAGTASRVQNNPTPAARSAYPGGSPTSAAINSTPRLNATPAAPAPAPARANTSAVAGSAAAPSVQARPAATQGNATATRKIALPADSSGGILTPAGMGSVGATSRPRAVPPSGGSGQASAGPSLRVPGTAAKPGTTTRPGSGNQPSPASRPGTTIPSGARGQSAPARPPATVPPGGF